MPIQENKHNNSTFSFVLLVILLVVGTIMSLQLSREKKDAEGFTKEETALLSSGDSVMYVLNVNDPDDEKILRIKSLQLGAEALKSNEYQDTPQTVLRAYPPSALQ